MGAADNQVGESSSDGEAPGASSIRGYRQVWEQFFKAVLLTVLLLIAKQPLENSAAGQLLRLRAYDFLQGNLGPGRAVRLPVVVVDSSELAREAQNPFAPSQKATSRPELQKVLKALARLRPVAIALDIDFSPDQASGGYITPYDPGFFRFCQRLHRETGVPIFLGVARGAALPPDAWLGAPEFAPLAAGILLPRSGTRTYYRSIQVAQGGISERGVALKSLAAALADRFRYGQLQQPATQPTVWDWALRLHSTQQPDPKLALQEFPVNYGPLKRLEGEAIATSTLLDGREERERAEAAIRGRAVLVGDIRRSEVEDRFAIGSHRAETGGVLLHACAAYTLIQAPLFELTERGRIVLDTGLGLLVLIPLTLLRLYCVRYPRNCSEKTVQRAEGIFLLGIAAGAFVLGVLLVRWTEVLWDDFPLVIGGMFLDPHLEAGAHKLGTVIQRIKQSKGEPDAADI